MLRPPEHNPDTRMCVTAYGSDHLKDINRYYQRSPADFALRVVPKDRERASSPAERRMQNASGGSWFSHEKPKTKLAPMQMMGLVPDGFDGFETSPNARTVASLPPDEHEQQDAKSLSAEREACFQSSHNEMKRNFWNSTASVSLPVDPAWYPESTQSVFTPRRSENTRLNFSTTFASSGIKAIMDHAIQKIEPQRERQLLRPIQRNVIDAPEPNRRRPASTRTTLPTRNILCMNWEQTVNDAAEERVRNRWTNVSSTEEKEALQGL